MNVVQTDCIEACLDCATACEKCAAACLAEPEIGMMRLCIELDRTCADYCTLAARELARRSEFAWSMCALCADVCDSCGEECEKHEAPHCKECAEACRRCAEACRAIFNH